MSNGIQKPATSSFHFFAGLSTGIFSALILQPADLLKTRLQQSHSTTLLSTLRAVTSGPRPLLHLWRGTVPSIIRTGLGSALYFSTLNVLRQRIASSNLLTHSDPAFASHNDQMYSSSSLPKLSNWANLTTGAMARVGAGMVMMPITVIKVRYESSLYSYHGIWSAGTAIWRHEGVKGFFVGFGATAIRDAPYAGLYVLFYEQLKQRLGQIRAFAMLTRDSNWSDGMKSRNSVPINFVSGVLAAGLATAITNPFDAIKTRLQLMPGKYGNMIKAGRQMVEGDGVKSLFDGLGLRLGRKVISSALAWTLYEELIRRAELKWGDV